MFIPGHLQPCWTKFCLTSWPPAPQCLSQVAPHAPTERKPHSPRPRLQLDSPAANKSYFVSQGLSSMRTRNHRLSPLPKARRSYLVLTPARPRCGQTVAVVRPEKGFGRRGNARFVRIPKRAIDANTRTLEFVGECSKDRKKTYLFGTLFFSMAFFAIFSLSMNERFKVKKKVCEHASW